MSPCSRTGIGQLSLVPGRPFLPAAATRCRQGCAAVQACAPGKPRKLILYSKPDCPICERLENQVSALLDRAQFIESELSTVTLEVCDISDDPQLQNCYGAQVPILEAVHEDGQKRRLPRFSPRQTTERLGIQLEKLFSE